MTYTNKTNHPDQTLQSFLQFGADDQLAILWFIYTEIAGSITPNANDNETGFAIAQGLVDNISQCPREEQLQAQRDIVKGNDSRFTQTYSSFNSSNRLAFWYLLAKGMESNSIVAMPANYQLSSDAQRFLDSFKGFGFEDQITFMRNVVSSIGATVQKGALS